MEYKFADVSKNMVLFAVTYVTEQSRQQERVRTEFG
jgi:hypothetical protein